MVRRALALVLLVASPVGAQSLTCFDLNGAYVVSQESPSQYLGFFGSQVASESIMNPVGEFGSSVRQMSVRNPVGPYGSSVRQYSAQNPVTFTPPVIAKAGNFVAFLTTNSAILGTRVSLAEIDQVCGTNTFFASSFVGPLLYPDDIPSQGGGGGSFLLKGAYGGTYFNASRDGEGVQATVIAGAPGRVNVIVIFYTYDLNGNPLYLVGATGEVSSATRGPYVASVVSTRGARFGQAFNPADVVRTPWGTVSLTFEACDSVRVSFQSSIAGYGAGTIPMTRLGNRPADQTCP